jgi:O-methyltransferase involved in polyketide biosynthesis
VLAFKLETLESHDVATIHVSGGMDRWKDWPKALADAGFDPSLPTAWSAEGFLPHLIAEAQDVLFDRIQALSASGSRVAVKAFANDFFSAESAERHEEQTEPASATLCPIACSWRVGFAVRRLRPVPGSPPPSRASAECW